MRKGSVIIDLAAQTGGNCVYTEQNKAVVTPNGVTVVGDASAALSSFVDAVTMLLSQSRTSSRRVRSEKHFSLKCICCRFVRRGC